LSARPVGHHKGAIHKSLGRSERQWGIGHVLHVLAPTSRTYMRVAGGRGSPWLWVPLRRPSASAASQQRQHQRPAARGAVVVTHGKEARRSGAVYWRARRDESSGSPTVARDRSIERRMAGPGLHTRQHTCDNPGGDGEHCGHSLQQQKGWMREIVAHLCSGLGGGGLCSCPRLLLGGLFRFDGSWPLPRRCLRGDRHDEDQIDKLYVRHTRKMGSPPTVPRSAHSRRATSSALLCEVGWLFKTARTTATPRCCIQRYLKGSLVEVSYLGVSFARLAKPSPVQGSRLAGSSSNGHR
jgi:hypothetical protein